MEAGRESLAVTEQISQTGNNTFTGERKTVTVNNKQTVFSQTETQWRIKGCTGQTPIRVDTVFRIPYCKFDLFSLCGNVQIRFQ